MYKDKIETETNPDGDTIRVGPKEFANFDITLVNKIAHCND